MSWLSPRESLGDYYRAIFEPGTKEIPNFNGVLLGVYAGFSHPLTDDELCVLSKEEIYSCEVNNAYIEHLSRRSSNFDNNPLKNELLWSKPILCINNSQLINLAGQYLKNVFEHLTADIHPTFELVPTDNGELAPLQIECLSSPWQSITLALYDYVSGTSPLKDCENPNCDRIFIREGRQAKARYCSESCEKWCNRHDVTKRARSRRAQSR